MPLFREITSVTFPTATDYQAYLVQLDKTVIKV